MSPPGILTVLDQQLLHQLGDRLLRLRKARGKSTETLAEMDGISRPTLRAVETGNPSASMGVSAVDVGFGAERGVGSTGQRCNESFGSEFGSDTIAQKNTKCHSIGFS